jgi:mono/diheme cytochrome c family protein
MKIIPIFTIRKLINICIILCLTVIAVTFLGCGKKIDPSFQQGKKLYEKYCVVCHGVNGDGVLYSESALNNNVFVTGDHKKVVTVILYGKEGAGSMPSWGQDLNDQEIAAVTTYIRQAWSNWADPVTPAMVKEIRSTGKKSF